MNDIARENNLVFDIKKVVSLSPVKFNSALVKTVQESCDLLGYSWEYIVSGAGHDACQLNHKFPTSMIFIPCVDGLSHNEAENITDDWCQKGAKVLLDSTVTLANQI
ncbi:MAG: M20/M25/M40 family metallo-hydrolase [Haemophilus sp.]|nr:M20/M25/M40 family metallo-hydrolase [Haemophilus sp.]